MERLPTKEQCHGYLNLANKAFSNIRVLIAENEFFQVVEIADSLHNLGDWESTHISLVQLAKDFPTRENFELLKLFKEIPETK